MAFVPFVGRPSSRQEQKESVCYRKRWAVGVQTKARQHFEMMEKGSAGGGAGRRKMVHFPGLLREMFAAQISKSLALCLWCF